jgi:hypothetical protein
MEWAAIKGEGRNAPGSFRIAPATDGEKPELPAARGA